MIVLFRHPVPGFAVEADAYPKGASHTSMQGKSNPPAQGVAFPETRDMRARLSPDKPP